MAELRPLQLTARLTIPVEFMSVRYARSGGPGGQHVNKVESKVDLRLDLAAATAVLGEDRVVRIRAHWQNRLDGDGQLQVVSSEHRQQSMNLTAALARMQAMLKEALAPKKVRRPTKPTKGSQRRRLTQKRQRSDLKRQRRSRGED